MGLVVQGNKYIIKILINNLKGLLIKILILLNRICNKINF